MRGWGQVGRCLVSLALVSAPASTDAWAVCQGGTCDISPRECIEGLELVWPVEGGGLQDLQQPYASAPLPVTRKGNALP